MRQWEIESPDGNIYHVSKKAGKYSCDCMESKDIEGGQCVHIKGVGLFSENEFPKKRKKARPVQESFTFTDIMKVRKEAMMALMLQSMGESREFRTLEGWDDIGLRRGARRMEMGGWLKLTTCFKAFLPGLTREKMRETYFRMKKQLRLRATKALPLPDDERNARLDPLRHPRNYRNKRSQVLERIARKKLMRLTDGLMDREDYQKLTVEVGRTGGEELGIVANIRASVDVSERKITLGMYPG